MCSIETTHPPNVPSTKRHLPGSVLLEIRMNEHIGNTHTIQLTSVIIANHRSIQQAINGGTPSSRLSGALRISCVKCDSFAY